MIEEQQAEQPATHSVAQVLSHMLDAVRAEAIFGQPVERGKVTVMLCSEMLAGLGMGSGNGPTDEKGNSYGGGSGGGGWAKARPIATIVITPEDIRVEPIVDVTKVALAAMTTGICVLFWLSRLRPTSRPDKSPSFRKVKKAINR